MMIGTRLVRMLGLWLVCSNIFVHCTDFELLIGCQFNATKVVQPSGVSTALSTPRQQVRLLAENSARQVTLVIQQDVEKIAATVPLERCQHFPFGDVIIRPYRNTPDYVKRSPLERRATIVQAGQLPLPFMFVHLPKTGGSSLVKTLNRYSEDILQRPLVHFWTVPAPVDVPTELTTKIHFKWPTGIFAHIPYGFHKLLFYHDTEENLSYSYLTILRHPVARVWSHYRYHHDRTGDPNHKWTKDRGFGDWLRTLEFGNNYMTAFLSGAIADAWYNRHELQAVMLPPIDPSAPQPLPVYNVTETHFQIALANLRKMAWVGIYEEFDASLCQLFYLLGSEHCYGCGSLNLNFYRPELPRQWEALILEYNRFDLLLYEAALAMFEEQNNWLHSRGYQPQQPLPWRGLDFPLSANAVLHLQETNHKLLQLKDDLSKKLLDLASRTKKNQP
jgi:hypothetical protein